MPEISMSILFLFGKKPFALLTPHTEQTTSKLWGETKQLIEAKAFWEQSLLPYSLRINNKASETWHQILSPVFFVKRTLYLEIIWDQPEQLERAY